MLFGESAVSVPEDVVDAYQIKRRHSPEDCNVKSNNKIYDRPLKFAALVLFSGRVSNMYQ